MTKFTSGPWDLDEGDLSTVYQLETSDQIAEVVVCKRTEANGRLIAAAPELFAALVETLAVAERNETGDYAIRAKAALEKALGAP